MVFNQLCAATVAAGAGTAIEAATATAIGAGQFLDAPQKAGADADRTVTFGHDAKGPYLKSSLRTADGLYPFRVPTIR
jgi:hypothetical protein